MTIRRTVKAPIRTAWQVAQRFCDIGDDRVRDGGRSYPLLAWWMVLIRRTEIPPPLFSPQLRSARQSDGGAENAQRGEQLSYEKV